MGNMNFLLPPNLPDDARSELERACVAGGPDRMPAYTQVTLQNGQMTLTRSLQESGFLQVPWEVPGSGRLLFSSATLMERPTPYDLARELARGKTNQLRSQAADWLLGGLAMSQTLADKIHQATHAFSHSLLGTTPLEGANLAQQTLVHCAQAADALVNAYAQQVFQIRHARQPKLESYLSCRLGALPRSDLQKIVPLAFNAVTINVPWRVLEPSEGDLRWQPFDELVQWTQSQNMLPIGGPLIDFSGFGLPDWLWARETDLNLLCDYLCEFIERIIRRYKGRIHLWQLTAGSNIAGVLALGEDELLWLTLRLAETAKQVDSSIEIILGLAQPFGDYLAHQERNHSPFAFADTLLRTGVKVGALDLELVMGIWPRGSYCRDLLDTSKLLDLYSFLGAPLQVTLAYPSAISDDPHADRDMKFAAGYWRNGFTPACQADWVQHYGGLSLCKPAVRGVQWCHLNDAVPHQYPHCGLVDVHGGLKPALDKLLTLRGDHLK